MRSPSATRFPPAFFVAMAASSLFFVSIVGLFPILPLYAQEIGLNDAEWGFSLAVIALVAAGLRMVGGPLADRFGRKVVLVFGGLAMAAGSVILGLTHTFAGFLLGRVMQGIAIGTFTTAYKALVVDLAPDDRRGMAIGLGNVTFSVALILAPPLAELLQGAVGFNRTFLLMAGAALIAALVVVPIRATAHTPTRRSMLDGARAVLPLPSTLMGLVGMLGSAFGFVALFTFMPLLAASRDISGVGLAYSVVALADMLGQPAGGVAGDRFGRRWIIAPGLVLTGAGILVFLVAQNQLALYAGAALTGFASASARVNLDTMVMNGAPSDLRGTASGWQYLAFDLWNGLLSWGLGIIALLNGYGSIYAIMAVSPVVVAAALWTMAPPPPDRGIVVQPVEQGGGH